MFTHYMEKHVFLFNLGPEEYVLNWVMASRFFKNTIPENDVLMVLRNLRETEYWLIGSRRIGNSAQRTR